MAGGRPKNDPGDKTLKIALAAETIAGLNLLAKKGYGKSDTEVARYLILREIDDLKRAGVLPQEGSSV